MLKVSPRRTTQAVEVGRITIGGDAPVRIQSMATVSTLDTDGCVAQAIRLIQAGAELVRFTTQGKREARNLKNIKAELLRQGYDTPIVADVHFNAEVADIAALYADKVRINPGNYVDGVRKFRQVDYTEEEYAAELRKIEQRLVPFLNLCRQHHTAIRIGVNHGSLSDRILTRYGDTPEGVVESCMEFLRICRKQQFDNVVVSIKASNTVLMVQSVRLLVRRMEEEAMRYPLHLGVTEAGEGEDGRIKSALGIGTLLAEGIGDTIRVSLSEEPERELPVARKITDFIEQQQTKASPRGGLEGASSLTPWEDFVIESAIAAGPALIGADAARHRDTPVNSARWDLQSQRSTDPIVLPPDAPFPQEALQQLSDGILQAARIKFTKTEYISCPGCGRTLYDLPSTLQRIKQATGHLVGMKIAVMGCIVNGPGEMADADYGYVGAGRGKVSLYRGKECVVKNIPEQDAVAQLLTLIENDRKAGK